MSDRDQGNKTSSGRVEACHYCGSKAPLVWVHGHGQCSNCGINTDECCRGEQHPEEACSAT